MRPRRRELGQAMTEFALVFPFFAILLFGIIDLGRYVYTANAINNGAREGARFATVSVRPAECAGLSRRECAVEVASSSSWGVASDAMSADATCLRVEPDGDTSAINIADCRTGDLLRVTTTSEFTLVTPLISQFVGDLTITGNAQMAVNQ